MCLVGFAIEIYYDAWPCECQNCVGNVLQSFGHLSIQNARVQRVCVCVCVWTLCVLQERIKVPTLVTGSHYLNGRVAVLL